MGWFPWSFIFSQDQVRKPSNVGSIGQLKVAQPKLTINGFEDQVRF